jgi:AcrR family transcriptional regulator
VLTQDEAIQTQDKRARLLEAAKRVMAERGVAGCTTKEIAKAAGVAEGTIYNQFEDKADLYLSVAGELIPELLRRLPEESKKPPRAQLIKVANETMGAMDELIPLLSGIIAEPELRAGARARWSGKRSNGRTPLGITEYFRAAQAAGTIGDRVDAPVLARMFLGAVFHHAFMRLLLTESDFELTGRRFVESVVDGVLAAAGPGATSC